MTKDEAIKRLEKAEQEIAECKAFLKETENPYRPFKDGWHVLQTMDSIEITRSDPNGQTYAVLDITKDGVYRYSHCERSLQGIKTNGTAIADKRIDG